MSPECAWDKVVHIACAAYNFVLNEPSKEFAFFLMFRRDAHTPLVQLLNPKLRCMTYSTPEFNVGDKVFIRNHTRDVRDPRYDFAYHVV